jgi:hypothetical protein
MEDNTPLCDDKDPYGRDSTRDIWVQIGISLALGLGAFLVFCVSLPQRIADFVAHPR